MRLSVEILDYIFGFLRVSHWETLVACSKDPMLSSIVKRHLYYHIIVPLGADNSRIDTRASYAFEPDRLLKLVSEDPCILHYVRILQIEVKRVQLLDELASTLLMFPVLECIMLIANGIFEAYFPDVFHAALGDSLKLPSLKKVELSGWLYFPLSILDNGKHIEDLSLTVFFDPATPDGGFSTPFLPQLKTLRLFTVLIPKFHISGLRSLKCRWSSGEYLLKLLGVCSETLTTLDLDLMNSQYLKLPAGEDDIIPHSELSLLSLNLHQLTIRTSVRLDVDEMAESHRSSSLVATAEVINQLISSIQHLVIDIEIYVVTLSDVAQVDFSPLVGVLETASLSVPKIDLYVYNAFETPTLTRAELLSLWEEYEDLTRLIKEGIVVVHSEEIAPEIV